MADMIHTAVLDIRKWTKLSRIQALTFNPTPTYCLLLASPTFQRLGGLPTTHRAKVRQKNPGSKSLKQEPAEETVDSDFLLVVPLGS